MMRRLTTLGPMAAALAMLCLAAAPLPGQALPKAEEILDRYVEALGGKEAHQRLKNRVSRGKVIIPPIEGSVLIYQAVPDRMYAVVEVPRVDKLESGVADGVAWVRTRKAGPQVQTGAEKALALRNASFLSDIDWRKLYKKAETVGEEKVGDTPCYKVELTTPEGDIVTRYFDRKTNLLVKTSTRARTSRGEIKSDSYPDDYRKVDGVLIAFKGKQVTASKGKQVTAADEIRFELQEVKHNTRIPDETFALPADIKKLLKKKGG